MSRTLDLLAGASQLAPLDPLWFVENQLGLPLRVDNTDAAEFATSVVFIFRIAIQLSQVFAAREAEAKGRSLAEDQMTIYQQLQSSLSAVGVDGRSCLLRFICEAQHRRMQRLNLLGQMLATLLTPKEDDFLASYSEAAAAGRGVVPGAVLRMPSFPLHPHGLRRPFVKVSEGQEEEEQTPWRGKDIKDLTKDGGGRD
ncbi:hypothetical protein C7M84_015814 [Penaeus vannamei]|uniref:Uncharacterized protein n=1 Tax=Penaeus vannamei TaxID=6689 RepID=A0A3R7QFY2_PENVA|nr:hypothetical protein C7M84_015814 [Penaeus vannamei]